jgi:peroxiredoxin
MFGRKVPSVTFRTRVRDESIEGPNPFRWENKTTDDYFKGKRVVLFSLPGAFTPTCSTYQLPISKSSMTTSRPRASTRSTAFRSMTPSS